MTGPPSAPSTTRIADRVATQVSATERPPGALNSTGNGSRPRGAGTAGSVSSGGRASSVVAIFSSAPWVWWAGCASRVANDACGRVKFCPQACP